MCDGPAKIGQKKKRKRKFSGPFLNDACVICSAKSPRRDGDAKRQRVPTMRSCLSLTASMLQSPSRLIVLAHVFDMALVLFVVSATSNIDDGVGGYTAGQAECCAMVMKLPTVQLSAPGADRSQG